MTAHAVKRLALFSTVPCLMTVCGCQQDATCPCPAQATHGDTAYCGGPEVRGAVFDEEGPVSGAVVRVQATDNATLTNRQGAFTLEVSMTGAGLTITAWKEDYYCAKVDQVVPPAEDISLTLVRYQVNDNPDYDWLPPIGENSCIDCKGEQVDVWLENAHAGSAVNQRFLTMYNGTDVDGNASPPTRYGYHPDYGRFPLPPDLESDYFGPGYKLDFPDTAGNCAACHIPGAAVGRAYATDPNEVSGADAYGIHCDFCHKVAAVVLDPATSSPFVNMPGVLSMDVRRPFPDDPHRSQLFFGTFDDVNADEGDTYLPLLEESAFCAPCHFGVFWDVVVYNSFGEWLESPYSDPETGKTCQQCHMPTPFMLNGHPVTNVAPGQGGIDRDPLAIHAHTQPGASNQELLSNAVTLTAEGRIDGDDLIVEVRIANDRTGHHVPTDSPLRHLILVVSATDAQGRALQQTAGPVIPEWCGVGDPSEGCYAGLPGKAYAKVLEELWTEISPTGAYWNPTRLVSDNRVPAFATNTSTYAFAAQDDGQITVHVTLLFRRAFHDLIQWKGWDVPDIVMEQAEFVLQRP